MSDTIAEAWDDMEADLPVTTANVSDLVNQVLDELSYVAPPPNSIGKQSEHDKPFQLQHGFSITSVDNQPVEGGGTRCVASIEGTGRLPLIISAQVRGFDRQLAATTAESGDEFIHWTPDAGPQKQWVLDNLRRRIAEYIRPAQTED